jgi:arylsulfatase A-like enzyme/Flp pilus assembly protein TadD
VVRRAIAIVLCLWFASCAGAPPQRSARRPSVLLITIDTLRADRLGRGLTPNLDALAARGTRYTQARTTVPLTLPSHTAILTGTLPPENGVRQNGDVLKMRPTLARVFHDAGYRTGAFVGAYVLDRRFGLSGGFDTYDDRVPRGADGEARLEAERRGDAVADAALAWLSTFAADPASPPFFAWVHFYDPHAPYDPPQEYLDKANGNPYDGEVAFADAQAGRLLDWLRASGQEASTIVAVAGDHGEGLGDHGESTHGMLAYDSTLRVPLVMAIPPGGPPRSVEQDVSLADLAGTLLLAAGATVPEGMRKGPLGAGGEAYSETVYPRTAGWHALSAIAFDQWKLIASSASELYDVRADPREAHNAAGEKLAIVDAARQRVARLAAPAGGGAPAVPDDAANRLRSLGYVSGAGIPIDDNAANPAKHIAAWNTFERALGRLSAGDSRGALPELSKLARGYRESPVFQSTYARALKETGRASEAVDLYRRLVTRWPRDAAMYHDLAVAAQSAGMSEEAIRAERASLALQPANADASNGLGLLLVGQGSAAEAVRAFERATEDDPSNAVFWANLGHARRAAGDSTRARQAYTRALEIDPRSADAANGVGALLVQDHQAAEAVAWFERALAGSPRFVEARLNLGIAYQESGNRDKAIDTYRRVVADAAPGSREQQTASQLLSSMK